MAAKKHLFLTGVVLLILLFAFAAGGRAAEECLNAQDKAIFMQMYDNLLSQVQTSGVNNEPLEILQKVDNIKAFLRSHGCSGELEDAEKLAPGILKSFGGAPALK